MLDGLLRRYSPAKSILLSSFLFGLVHLNPWQFVGAMIIGVFAGWIYYRTRKLSYAIAIHLGNNLFAFLWMSISGPETFMDQSTTEFYGGSFQATLLIAGACISALGLVYHLDKRLGDYSWGEGESEVQLPETN